jgi:hypothetical protein
LVIATVGVKVNPLTVTDWPTPKAWKVTVSVDFEVGALACPIANTLVGVVAVLTVAVGAAAVPDAFRVNDVLTAAAVIFTSPGPVSLE